MLVLISYLFHTFSVNSQNIFLSADFVCDKCLVLIQTCLLNVGQASPVLASIHSVLVSTSFCRTCMLAV